MRTLISTIAVALTLTACTGGGGGGLTVEKLEAAKEGVHSMQPKADAMKSLEAALGAPAKSDENGMSWFAKDGDACKELHVQLMGDMVGNTELKKSACPE